MTPHVSDGMVYCLTHGVFRYAERAAVKVCRRVLPLRNTLYCVLRYAANAVTHTAYERVT